MDDYERMVERINEKEKRVNELIKSIDKRVTKTMTISEGLSLDEIVSRLNKPGVSVTTIDIEETAERDMQDFGRKTVFFYDDDEMKKYSNTGEYHFRIKLTYNSEPVELNVYRNILTMKSLNPDLNILDIYDDTKKNELDDMLNNDFDNKEMVDNSNYKLK